jgi:RHS repeat-associated protein
VWLGDLPIAVSQPSGRYYIAPDHLGAPHQITNAASQPVWLWDHDPFGNGTPTTIGSFTYNLRFPGQYYDKLAGLNYNYFRDYDPKTGRYIESDPIGLEGGINTYGYVAENPLSFSDPYGLNENDSNNTGVLQALFPAHTAAFSQCPLGGSTENQIRYANNINDIRKEEAMYMKIALRFPPEFSIPFYIPLIMKNFPMLFLSRLSAPNEYITISPPSDNYGQPGGCGDPWCLLRK